MTPAPHPAELLKPICRGWFIVTAVLMLSASLAGQSKPNLVLSGTISGQDNQTYKLVPFTVPASTTRITVEFSHTGRGEKTVVNLGVIGPNGFRGWSGGRLGTFTISNTDASPSYLAGRIEPGTWNLLLGIPNIRPSATATWLANVYLSHSENAADGSPGVYPVLSHETRWYRGDLHMHTEESDGSCKSQLGKTVPCPVFFTAAAAAKRGLDFIAITDHNTMAQYEPMRQMQPYFDGLLLIPGRELTTFQGHANVFGTTAYLDFRVGSREVPTWNALLEQVHSAGALISINHPRDPSGEDCMGCGWTPNPSVNMRLVQAVEAVNGVDVEGPHAGIPFWQDQLNRGYRLSGIAGSDNHNGLIPVPGPGSIGYPTTVVYARELSIGGILDAILAGHVFIDVTGSNDRALEISASSGAERASMGDVLQLAAGQSAEFTVHVTHMNGGKIEIIVDGAASSVLRDDAIGQDDQTFTFQWKSDGGRHWVRANVRDANSKLALVGNPVYVNFGENTQASREGR